MTTLGVSLHYSPSRSKTGNSSGNHQPQHLAHHQSWTDSTTTIKSSATAFSSSSSSSSPTGVNSDPLMRLRQQDGKVLLLTGQLEKRKTLIEQQNAAIQTLTNELQLRDQTIQELSGKLSQYQMSFKQADGRISLLKYQLEKMLLSPIVLRNNLSNIVFYIWQNINLLPNKLKHKRFNNAYSWVIKRQINLFLTTVQCKR